MPLPSSPATLAPPTVRPFRWSDRPALDVLLLTLESMGAQGLDVCDGTVRALRQGAPWSLPALPLPPTVEDLRALLIDWAPEDSPRHPAADPVDEVLATLDAGRRIVLGRTLLVDRHRRLRFRLEVVPSAGDGPIVRFRWMPLFPQPLVALGLGPRLTEQLRELPRNGLVLIGGGTGVGSTTLLNATLSHWSRSDGGPFAGPAASRPRPGRACLLSHRHEQWFTMEGASSHAGTVTQRLPGGPDNNLASSLAATLRTDPDLVAVDGVRDREEMGASLTAAETGHLVLATVYADQGLTTVFHRLRGLAGPCDGWLDATRLLVWQGWAERPDGQRLRVQEHLVLDGPTRAEILAAHPDRLDAVLHEAMVRQGGDVLTEARARQARGQLDAASLAAIETWATGRPVRR